MEVADEAPEPIPELLDDTPLVAVDDEDSDEGLATEQDEGEQDVMDEEEELWLVV